MIETITHQLKYSIAFKLGEELISVWSNEPLDALNVISERCICYKFHSYNYKIILYKCCISSDIYIKSLSYRDKTVRNDYFNRGYYVCDHFGKPINIITEGNTMMVFGEDFSRVFWSYIIKYLMQIWALNNDSLFTKCSAFSINNQGTLLIGCGGSGKTMINSHVCSFGAQFITNSNAYIRDNKIMGIGSKMRVRVNKHCASLQGSVSMSSGLEKGEMLVDPLISFSSNIDEWIPIKNVVIVNYDKGTKKLVPINRKIAFSYAQQFFLGINVYRLEEDVLNYYNNNIFLFSEKYASMICLLGDMINECECYFADIDICDKKTLEQFMGLL